MVPQDSGYKEKNQDMFCGGTKIELEILGSKKVRDASRSLIDGNALFTWQTKGVCSAQLQAVSEMSEPCLSGHSEVKKSKAPEDTSIGEAIGCAKQTSGRRM
jgi:hypothetical protein